MILAIDVHYKNEGAKAVGILFSMPDEMIHKTIVERISQVNSYEPGKFYKRELPCLQQVMNQVEQEEISAVIVDGHVYVNNSGEFGLGAKLWEALDQTIPVIGVAKNSFDGNKQTVHEIIRGRSKKPLYISSIGMPLDEAASLILKMTGQHRMPDLIKKVDTNSKQP
jgi:deoxyribonuclease V